jgi:hypothetical protein
MVGIRSPDGLVVGPGSCTARHIIIHSVTSSYIVSHHHSGPCTAPATLEFWVRFPNEKNKGKQAHPVLKCLVPHGSLSHANKFVIGTAVINTHTSVSGPTILS